MEAPRFAPQESDANLEKQVEFELGRLVRLSQELAPLAKEAAEDPDLEAKITKENLGKTARNINLIIGGFAAIIALPVVGNMLGIEPVMQATAALKQWADSNGDIIVGLSIGASLLSVAGVIGEIIRKEGIKGITSIFEDPLKKKST